MAQVTVNDTVTVRYTGSFMHRTVFDFSTDREPFEFTVGQGMVIPRFENGIIGMNEGDSKEINITAKEAYGPHRNDLIAVIERSRIPAGVDLQVGMKLQIPPHDGGIINVIIRDMSDENVALDLNHPHAGKELISEIKLIKISPVS